MMKFQGRQTVRNMLVMTLLIAGAYFASFYAPMLSTSSENAYAARPIDLEYYWRADQSCPNGTRCRRWRRKQTSRSPPWRNRARPCWASDGTYSIERDGIPASAPPTRPAYAKLLHGATFFLGTRTTPDRTGRGYPAGACANILDDEGGGYLPGGDATHLTNMATGAELDVTPIGRCGTPCCLAAMCVLDDMVHAVLTEGLTDVWREDICSYLVADVENSYPVRQGAV